MNEVTETKLSIQPPAHDSLPALFGGSMSPAIQIMLDDRLFERAKLIAKYMAAAEGFVPGHLINKTEACFAVVMRSLTWKLDPFAVAQCTYSPAAGKVGFEGKLCQAIIENSGKVSGGVDYETYGDWTKVHGKFALKTNDKGKKYPVATYTDDDEVGLGVIAFAQVTGEKKRREFRLDLRQAHPRNSTLWATDPLTQLKYRAARGLGNLAMPGIFMGVPFEREDFLNAGENAVDVTPSAAKNIHEELKREAAKDKPKTVDIDPNTGEVIDPASTDSSPPKKEITPPEPKLPAFDIRKHEAHLKTHAGAKAAAEDLIGTLSAYPQGERSAVFLGSSGAMVVDAMRAHGLALDVKKIEALGISVQPASEDAPTGKTMFRKAEGAAA